MNKFGIVLGAAAVVTLAGCKDPDYKYASASPSQGEVKSVETTDAPAVSPSTTIEPAPAPTCKCAPGTKHAEPCKCGAPDCKCIILGNAAPVPAVVPAVVAAEPVYTEYVVQEGDYLSKISKRYNVTMSSIYKLNPSIKKDVIRVGQKIKLPGTIDVGVQKTPAKAATAAKATTVKKSAAAYTGATKEYVVKNGDTLGSIAYGNGITIRQLKQLNGLTKDTLKIGQKLKIPAEKVVATAPVANKAANKAPEKRDAAAVTPSATTPSATVTPVAVPDAGAPAPVANENKEAATPPAPNAATTPAAAPAKETAAATTTYVVQEGDDMTGVSIRWGVSAAEIRELNNLGEKDQLVPGQIIKLPAEAQQ